MLDESIKLIISSASDVCGIQHEYEIANSYKLLMHIVKTRFRVKHTIELKVIFQFEYFTSSNILEI